MICLIRGYIGFRSVFYYFYDVDFHFKVDKQLTILQLLTFAGFLFKEKNMAHGLLQMLAGRNDGIISKAVIRGLLTLY